MRKTKETTIDTLARIVDGGFKEMREGFKGMRKEMHDRFDKVEGDIHYIYGSLDVIQREISEIKKELSRVVYREELEAVKARISKLEKKLGI
jgi:BMFP domain-containing protein YqiC